MKLLGDPEVSSKWFCKSQISSFNGDGLRVSPAKSQYMLRSKEDMLARKNIVMGVDSSTAFMARQRLGKGVISCVPSSCW